MNRNHTQFLMCFAPSLIPLQVKMKKNSLELRKKQHQMLIEQEKREQEKRARREANSKKRTQDGDSTIKEVRMKHSRRSRREYKAQRRKARLEKYAPRLVDGDVDMSDISKPKNIAPVSKTLRLVKDKSSIKK
jgi:hypothetical protein